MSKRQICATAAWAVLGVAVFLVAGFSVNWFRAEREGGVSPGRVSTVEVEPLAADAEPAERLAAAERSEPAEAASSTAALSFQEGYQRVERGMTYDEVCDLVGNDILVILEWPDGRRLVQWSGGERHHFAVRFRDGKVESITSLQTRPVVTVKPEPKTFAGSDAAGRSGAETVAPSERLDSELEPPVSAGAGESDMRPLEQASVVTERSRRERYVRIGGGEGDQKTRPRVRKARLPKYSGQIRRGPHDVLFFNYSENALRVGVREGMRGVDFRIPAGGSEALFFSNGSYMVYYIDEGDPETLKSGGMFTVDTPPVALRVHLGEPEAEAGPEQG